jgi:hypothetical protein
MEDGLVNNTSFLEPEDGLKFIVQVFENNNPDYKMKIYNWGGFHGYGVIGTKDNIEIKLGSGRGRLDYYLKISDKIIDLLGYDENLKSLHSASGENFHFVFNAIKRFLSDSSYKHYQFTLIKK